MNDITRHHREAQSHVLEFVFDLARQRQLLWSGLASPARGLAGADAPVEVERLKSEITRGTHSE